MAVPSRTPVCPRPVAGGRVVAGLAVDPR